MSEYENLTLDECRKRIDLLDGRIAVLFSERLEICDRIAEIKAQQGLAVMNRAREEQVTEKVRNIADSCCADDVARLYESVFAVSRARQERKNNNGC